MPKKTLADIYKERAAARELTRSRAANPLKLQDGDIERYKPEMLKKLPVSDVRKEYSRLRHIALKRMQRMQGTQWARTETYKKHIGAFPSLSEIENSTELLTQLYETARFVAAKSSSIKGNELTMYKSLATLHKNGYDFVNPDNFISFGKFIQIWRESALSRLFSSDEWSEAFQDLEESGRHATLAKATIIKREFDHWLQSEKEVSRPDGEMKTWYELKNEATSYGYEPTVLGVREYLHATPEKREKHKERLNKKR